MVGRYDAIVIGLGAMGSATLYHLAKRGLRVAGFDRFDPPHEFGSSTGETRIIREAYFENPVYVPMVQRAYELWSELERLTGSTLLRPSGGLMIGKPGSATFEGAKASAKLHHLAHEILTGTQVRERFPAFHVDDGMKAVLEPRAGALDPESCIRAHLDGARSKGADIFVDEPVTSWTSDGRTAQVATARRALQSDGLAIAAGPWMNESTRDLQLPLRVERQFMCWFKPPNHESWFRPDRFPVFIMQFDERRMIYGVPDLGNGVKFGIHHEGEAADANRVRRTVGPEEIAGMRSIVRRFFPSADAAPHQARVCLYTNTPDENFILDRHPKFPNVVIGSPCSGHGFKFSSAVGEILADLLAGRNPRFDLAPFRIGRFGGSPRAR